jgi:DNA-binding beta-propeller fold protein YncE
MNKVTTIAGTGKKGCRDGVGTVAHQFNEPRGVAVDGDGNVFVVDTCNHRIRKITSQGHVSRWQALARWGIETEKELLLSSTCPVVSQWMAGTTSSWLTGTTIGSAKSHHRAKFLLWQALGR